MTHARTTSLATLALLLIAAAGEAQQVSGRLSLDDALRLAHDHNPAFQRARNDLDVAGNGIRAAWAAAFLPSLNTSMSFSGTRNTAVTGLDPFGQLVRMPDPVTSRGSTASQNVSTQFTLFDGFGSFRQIGAQRALYEATEAQVAAQQLQLVAQVSREYFQAVRTQRFIALEETLLASASDRLAREEELMRVAARNRVDVLGARADVAQAEQNLHRARGESDKARLSLAVTIGLEPTAELTVDTVLPRVFDPGDVEPAVLVARALASHPAVHQREAALQAARHRAGAARGRRLPSVTANAGYGRSVNERGYGAFGELNPLNYGFNFGMTVSMPLFSRFQTANAVAEASAAVHDAEHDVRAARLTVERDVRAGLIDLENAYRSLQLAEQRAALSRERQDLTQEQYRLGGVTFNDLQNVIDRTADAERQALDARFNFINARLNLEEKLGARLEG
jgi:outer membrane protein